MSDASHPVRRAGRRAPFASIRPALGRVPEGLARFLIVGVGGLSVDIAILWLLEQAGLGHAVARAISLCIATLVTWTLNRRFTFADSGRAPGGELGRYALVAVMAQSVNYLVFLGVCAGWPHLVHSLAAVIGAVVATGFSYTGQRFFTFAPAAAVDPPRALSAEPVE